MCDIVFEKPKGRGGTVNRTNVYAEVAVKKVFWKRTCEKFRKIRKKAFVLESNFLIKLNSADLQLY